MKTIIIYCTEKEGFFNDGKPYIEVETDSAKVGEIVNAIMGDNWIFVGTSSGEFSIRTDFIKGFKII